jgi:hypothetical protein
LSGLFVEIHSPTLCFECNIRKKRATKPVRACEPAREPDQVPVQRPEPAREPDQDPVQFFLHYFAISGSSAFFLNRLVNRIKHPVQGLNRLVNRIKTRFTSFALLSDFACESHFALNRIETGTGSCRFTFFCSFS